MTYFFFGPETDGKKMDVFFSLFVERSHIDTMSAKIENNTTKELCLHLFWKLEDALRLCLVPFKLPNIPSHQIFGHMYAALNVDEKKIPIAQFPCKL